MAITNTGVLITKQRQHRDDAIGQVVLPDRAPRADHHADHGAHDRADDQQPQADADAPPQFVGHRLSADGGAEVAVHHAGHPVAVADRDRLVEIQLGGLGVDDGLRRPRIALQQAVERLELTRGQARRSGTRPPPAARCSSAAAGRGSASSATSLGGVHGAQGMRWLPRRPGCCFSSVARQFAPALKAVSSLVAYTGFHLQVYRSPRWRGRPGQTPGR